MLAAISVRLVVTLFEQHYMDAFSLEIITQCNVSAMMLINL